MNPNCFLMRENCYDTKISSATSWWKNHSITCQKCMQNNALDKLNAFWTYLLLIAGAHIQRSGGVVFHSRRGFSIALALRLTSNCSSRMETYTAHRKSIVRFENKSPALVTQPSNAVECILEMHFTQTSRSFVTIAARHNDDKIKVLWCVIRRESYIALTLNELFSAFAVYSQTSSLIVCHLCQLLLLSSYETWLFDAKWKKKSCDCCFLVSDVTFAIFHVSKGTFGRAGEPVSFAKKVIAQVQFTSISAV